MDYSDIDCPQFYSFSQTVNEEESDSYFDIDHETEQMTIDNSVSSVALEEKSCANETSVYSTPKLKRISGSMNVIASPRTEQNTLLHDTSDDMEQTVPEHVLDSTDADTSHEDDGLQKPSSANKTTQRKTPVRKSLCHQSVRSSPYDLRPTPSRLVTFKKLMDSSIDECVKAVLRTPSCAHLLRSQHVSGTSEQKRTKKKNSMYPTCTPGRFLESSGYQRGRKQATRCSHLSTPRPVRKSQPLPSRLSKVRFANIENLRTPSSAFRVKKAQRKTPHRAKSEPYCTRSTRAASKETPGTALCDGDNNATVSFVGSPDPSRVFSDVTNKKKLDAQYKGDQVEDAKVNNVRRLTYEASSPITPVGKQENRQKVTLILPVSKPAGDSNRQFAHAMFSQTSSDVSVTNFQKLKNSTAMANASDTSMARKLSLRNSSSGLHHVKVPYTDSKSMIPKPENFMMGSVPKAPNFGSRSSTQAAGSTKSTTVQPFHFRTDDRTRKQEQKVATKERDFVSSLRRNTPKAHMQLPRVTKVQPFNLTAPKKRKMEEPAEEYKSLAQKIEEHLKKTPKRFKMGPVNRETEAAFSPLKLVKPRSPKLLTSKRYRPVHVMSRQEEEELEVQNMKAYKFHAQPVDARILKGTPSLPKVDPKPPTKPLGIHLETEKRCASRPKPPEEEERFVFHAREVPKNILEGPVGIKEKQVKPVTKPVSPDFALKHRSTNWSHHSSPEQPQIFQFKATAVPHIPPFKPHVEKKKPTEVAPFSFDEKDKQRYSMKEVRVKQELEKEKQMRKFKANPIPSSVLNSGKKSRIPNRLKRPVTQPKEFVFHTEKTLSKSSRKTTEAANDAAASCVFKAAPAKVLTKAPFQPQKPVREPLAPTEFQLSTEIRAMEREKKKELQMMIDANQEELIRQRAMEEQRKEEEEIKQLRAETVHKANPVKVYKPVVIKPSSKPLTHPKTPRFATDERITTRHTSLN